MRMWVTISRVRSTEKLYGIVWDVSFPLLFPLSFCIIPLLTSLYFSEKQEAHLLYCMKIQ